MNRLILIFCFLSGYSFSQQTPVFLAAFTNGGTFYDEGGFGTLSVLTGDASIINTFNLPNENPGLDAQHPELIETSNGKIYGLHRDGGNEGLGLLFEFDPLTQFYSIKHEFSDSGLIGHSPEGGMILLPDGRLLGTTSSGGINQSGTIFSFSPINGAVHVEAQFGNSTAKWPSGQLLMASDGWVYGTTSNGGLSGLGTIYRFHPNTNQLQVVYEFNSIATGTEPTGGLCELSDGKLYGFCKSGGEAASGVIYSFQLNNQQYQVVKSFGWNGDYGYPETGNAPVKLDESTFIAVLANGGTNGNGSLLKWSTSTPDPEFLYQFSVSTGGQSNGRIVKHSNGNWYWLSINFTNAAQVVEYNFN